ncbi:hypothetical protein QQF64_000303 [Cirrhinus molitorella]|uniref:Deoxynucleoside triphosphate triphosphohydrolase SAMHD1-like n=1 Tax=Cirrhinus molitorella TaxID=172907 RepID=A0ABR3NYD0_9TELE
MIFNDPIHGHMELHILLVKIIDHSSVSETETHQTAGRKIPGLSCVAYLAGCLVKTLHDNQPEFKINKFLLKKIFCVFKSLACVTTWHEQMSVQMFDDIVKSLKAENKDVLKEHGLDDKDVIFIKELIEGAKTSAEWRYEGRDEDKSFLYEIVANKQNGIDVDKWDYFTRDCHHLGIQNSFDHQRLLKFARVCKVNERNHICFRDKEADNVYDMFRTRYTLHRQAYQHKIANIIEDVSLFGMDYKNTKMLAEALVRADRDLHEGKPEDMLKISEAIKTAEDYSILTEARDILNKIVRRKLPKFVGEARLTEKNKSKDKNPIEYVYFYSKRKPNEASAIKDYQLSSFLPKKFNEELVRVYYKRTDVNKEEVKKKVEEAEKCFQIWCDSKFGLH